MANHRTDQARGAPGRKRGSPTGAESVRIAANIDPKLRERIGKTAAARGETVAATARAALALGMPVLERRRK